MKYLIVEGITDVALVKYICFKNNITTKFNEFQLLKSKDSQIEIYEIRDKNIYIINTKGEKKLKFALEILKPEERDIDKIGIIQDSDKDFQKSKENIEKAIEDSNIDKAKIEIFLTPNNKDLGDLETLLLSTLDKENIPQLQCFQDYKSCLNEHINIDTKAIDKGELYSYTMFSKDGKDYFTPQNSFMYKKNKKYYDTELWNLEKSEFYPIINFISRIFTNDNYA